MSVRVTYFYFALLYMITNRYPDRDRDRDRDE